MPEQLSLIFNISAFCIGACIGSFLNVCIWRIPRNESVISPPSHCPKCNQTIKCYQNIPIISWLLLGGKCSSCKTSISGRYIIIELITAILFLLFWNHIWTNALPLSSVVPYAFVVASLIAITVIDIEHQRIPNVITFTGIIIAATWCISFPYTHFRVGIGTIHSGEIFRHDPIMYIAIDAIQRWVIGFDLTPRFLAALNVFLGVFSGGGLLFFFAKSMKFVVGKRHVKTDTAVVIEITPTAIQINSAPMVRLNDFFRDHHDRLQISGRILDLSILRQDPAFVDQANVTNEKIVVTDSLIVIRGTSRPISDLERLRIETVEWIEPREVMGMGDIKLMAMVGAFLGPGAALIILSLSSILGTMYGVFRGVALFLRRTGSIPDTLPFGPFIAVATVSYLLLWHRVLNIIWHTTRFTF